MSSRDVTQARIAKEIGFDRTTVSAILNNRSGMSFRPETRRMVLDTANRLGYRPHRHAQLMRGKKSGVLGVIQFGGIGSFGSEKAAHVASAIHKTGYEIFTTDVAWYDKRAGAACSAMLDAHVEGAILLTPSAWFPESELERLRAAQIPMVGLSGVKFSGVPQVRPDTRQGMFDLTQHLLRLGYRRLAMVTMEASAMEDESRYWPLLDRMHGFRDAVKAAQDARVKTDVICEGSADAVNNSYQCGEEAMKKLLQRAERPEAVACSNDDWAFGALGACGDAGLRVPDNIAVTGFDGTLASGYGSVRLTTAAQPMEAMAQKAVEILVKQVRGEKLLASEELVKLPCQLVVRQSCGAARVWKNGAKADLQSFQSGKS